MEIPDGGYLRQRGIPRLQWGHAFSDVEIRDDAPSPYRGVELQWGHAFSDVEIPSDEKQPEDDNIYFNGATPFQTWKFYDCSRC